MVPTILAIDDAPEALMTVRIAARGSRLLTATTGAEAMRLIAEHIQSVDVVILDLILPDMDGAMLCAIIRQHAAGVPIIPLTGHPEALRKIAHLGISPPIIKPAEAAEIRRVLQEVLGMSMPVLEATGPHQAIQQRLDFPSTNGAEQTISGQFVGAADYQERPELLPVRGATWDDLDLAMVELHIQRAISRRGYDGTDDPLGYLRHHECVVGGGFRPQPTLVGLIAFGFRPERFLTSEIDIAKFSTIYEEPGSIVKRRTIKGTAFTQIEDSLSFLDTLNPQRSRMEGAERIDEHAISPHVLREVVNNAVLHRDWSVRGAGIQIKLFPDRLEVLSPGGLPQGITVDTIGLTPGVRRNPALAELLRNAGYVERFGIGYKLIYRVLEEWGLGAPTVIDHGSFFSVSIPARRLDAPPAPHAGAQPIPPTLIGRLREIVRAVEEIGGQATRVQIQERLQQMMEQRAGQMSKAELNKLYAVSVRHLQRHLAELVEMGLLFEVGQTNKRHYFRHPPY
jgi:predicted HTH transcriptional regulator/FixJ family two-component response regulator